MAIWLSFLPPFGVVLALTLYERWRGAPATDWVRNVQAWVVVVVAAALLMRFVPGWTGPALLDGARLPFWASFPIFLLVKDLGEYLYHRAQHRVPFLWAMHSLHHSDPEMCALTTQRHFWGDQALKQLTVWAAALMVIRPTPAILFAYGIVSLWNFVAHLDAPWSLGRWSWAINMPAYHRRHHSRLPEHYDSNFAALFPLFDVICGSYHRPTDFPPTGLDSKPEGWGELVIWPLIWNRAKAPAAKPATV